MTPTEKAREIFNKYHEFEFSEFVNDKDAAKQCALIVTEEIISSWGSYNERYEQELFDSEWEYWQEVKQELEKL